MILKIREGSHTSLSVNELSYRPFHLDNESTAPVEIWWYMNHNSNILCPKHMWIREHTKVVYRP